MKMIEEVNSVLEMTQDWDSNWNEALIYLSHKNNWSEIQKMEFLYKEELYLRSKLESVLSNMVESIHSESLYENVKYIFTKVDLGIRSLVIEELLELHKSWVINNFLDEDIFKKEFDSLFNSLNQEVIKYNFMAMSKEIHILASISNGNTSPVLSTVLCNMLELIQYDLIELFKNALFKNDEVSLYPSCKKSLREIQIFSNKNATFTRVVTWRGGELHLDFKTGEVKLGHCFDKCDVEYDDYSFKVDNDVNKSESVIFDELESKRFELINTWFEIDGQTKLSIDYSDQETDL